MGIEQTNNIRFRYPGSKFFEADQNDIFFGRNEEVLSLIHSIKAHDIFVIFADSGIGKTSLLNAGLIPEFENEDEIQKIIPVKFRFQDINIPPLQTIVKRLSGYVDKEPGIESGSEKSLWRLLNVVILRTTRARTIIYHYLSLTSLKNFLIIRKRREKNA